MPARQSLRHLRSKSHLPLHKGGFARYGCVSRYCARMPAAQAQSLHLNSGTVRNLYLNLDEIADWDVNTGSFHIDTEHLSGSRYHRCLLQKNECRRVFWTPLKDDASLSVELKQAVKIEVGE